MHVFRGLSPISDASVRKGLRYDIYFNFFDQNINNICLDVKTSNKRLELREVTMRVWSNLQLTTEKTS